MSTSLSESFFERLSMSFLDEVGAQSIESPLAELGKRRFLFVTGKGGVGKTTVSAALATALAAQGKRVLVVMCNTKERLSAILGTPPIGADIAKVGTNVWAVNAEPERALIEYAAMVIKVKTLVNTVFSNEYIKSFLRAVPGLFEWAMLGKAWFHTTETDRHGKPVYDVVIFDAPSTGHGLDMLRVPKVILDVAPPGVLRRDAERAVAMLRDHEQSGVVVVTLPEEMPVTETLELCGAVHSELGMPVLRVIVNAVLPPIFSDSERAELARRVDLLTIEAAAHAGERGQSAAVASARRALREEVQRESTRRLLESTNDPVLLLPHLFDEASTHQGTSDLATLLRSTPLAGRAARQ